MQFGLCSPCLLMFMGGGVVGALARIGVVGMNRRSVMRLQALLEAIADELVPDLVVRVIEVGGQPAAVFVMASRGRTSTVVVLATIVVLACIVAAAVGSLASVVAMVRAVGSLVAGAAIVVRVHLAAIGSVLATIA